MPDPQEIIEPFPDARFTSGMEMPHRKMTRYGLILESGLFALAIGFSYFGFYDHHQRLDELHQLAWQMPVVVGLLAVVPMVVLLLAVDYLEFTLFREIRAIADKLLHPLFEGISFWKIVVISLSAGIGEEMLFRWCIQGGIRQFFESPFLGIGISILIAALIFGICHWLSFAYALFAFATGIYFGVIMELTDSVVAAIVAHAVYDFVALIYIVYLRKPPKKPAKSELPAVQFSEQESAESGSPQESAEPSPSESVSSESDSKFTDR